MPPRPQTKDKSKRKHENRLLGELAEVTMDRIGGPNRIADIINEGLASSSIQVRNKALVSAMDLVKSGSEPEIPVEEMADNDIVEELEVFIGRTLVQMRVEDFEPFMASVMARRAAIEEGRNKVALARARQENPPAGAESFVMPPLE